MSLLPFKNTADDLFSFAGSVGRFGDNNRDDVIKAQALLANAGYYDLPEPGMPTGWPGGELNRALIKFQKDHGLEADGTLLPLDPAGVTETGVGETVQALQDELGVRLKGLAAPNVQEADDFYRDLPKLAGEGVPATDVHLQSDDGNRVEYPGLKKVRSDAPPSYYELRPGQQEARAPGPGGVRTAPQPARPPMARPPATTPLQPPPSTPPQYGPFLPIPRERIPDEWLEKPSPLRPPQIPPPQNDTGPTGKPPPIVNRPDAPGLGRIIIAEDGKELYVPPLGAWADDLSPEKRQIAEGLSDAFITEMALHTGGSRGNALTQEGVNIAIRECMDIAQEIFPDAEITHVFGGNQDGNADRDSLREEHLWQYDENGNRVHRGSRRPDFGILVARSVVEMVRGNTFDSDGKGNPVDRESSARDDIGGKTEGEQMAMFEKQGKHMTADEFRHNVREVCRDKMEKLRGDWEQRGELQKPPSKTWHDYPGPASARRAKELRDRRKPLP